ncbi:MAG: UTP--glucose-1-phosphate uridylyltransferase [Parcubacteria group bacterium]|nr:UTP--glucose-1-phosphate uridylyltransferase [Parcubacteria group bacterium]
MAEITKAILPIAGLGTRYLPVSKAIPKELLPLVDKPLVQYAVEEAKASGITEIIFVVNSNRKFIEDYFRRSLKLEKTLEERKQEHLLKLLKRIEELGEGMTFSFVSDKSLGDGHAILQAKKLVADEPCLVMFPDDVVDSEVPCAKQLCQVFKTAQKPVFALYELKEEQVFAYGVARVETIAKRFYKLKEFVEKPNPGTAPSNLVWLGRAIITPEVFGYLKKARPNKKGEIILAEALSQMLRDGIMVYGYEVEGKWLECGDKIGWLRSNLYLSLKHPEFGKTMTAFLKEEKLL